MHDLLIDTDVLIWYLRGHSAAAHLLNEINEPILSAVTFIELMQGCRNKRELSLLKKDIEARKAKIIPIDASISNLAVTLIKTHALSSGLQLADALIAATGIIHGLTVITANSKHFNVVDELLIERFIP